MPKTTKNMIDYMVVCVNDYADRKGITPVESFDRLSKGKGLSFLRECYDAEHTLSLDEALDDIDAICLKNEKVSA